MLNSLVRDGARRLQPLEAMGKPGPGAHRGSHHFLVSGSGQHQDVGIGMFTSSDQHQPSHCHRVTTQRRGVCNSVQMSV